MDKEKIAERIGRNVFLLRRQAGLSQGELGKKVGMAQPNVSTLERGRMLPSMEKFIRLCQALEVRPDQLLKGVLL
jgi:transcriptional regulator with XRE-family HTH domain